MTSVKIFQNMLNMKSGNREKKIAELRRITINFTTWQSKQYAESFS